MKWLICAVSGFGLLLAALGALAAPTINLLYFGASDCPTCRVWEAKDLPRLKASPYWSLITFTKITKAISSPLPSKVWWPAEVQPLYDAVAAKFAKKRIKTGSPMSALVIDGKVVSYGFGSRKLSPEHLLPIIKAAVGEQPAAGK